LRRHGLRARLDDDVDQSFGRRVTEWDLQGVPVRIEIGPREIADDTVVVYRRDTREKRAVALRSAADDVLMLMNRLHGDMLGAATQRRDSVTRDCSTLEEACDAAQSGVARVPWGAVGESGERTLAASGVTVRCLQSRDGALPPDDDDAIAYVARAY
jgi:prolyl-tRNA synthetase